MPALTAVADLDLSLLPGKTYFSSTREWREEFIYFLIVDRFHDDKARHSADRFRKEQGLRHSRRFLWRQNQGHFEKLGLHLWVGLYSYLALPSVGVQLVSRLRHAELPRCRC